MEPFLTTLPPYVHQYINKYPPTECFNVLKDLVCFAVLYSNDREHINLLSLELLQKGADRILVHHPYASSTLNVSTLTSKDILRASPTRMDSVVHQQLSPTTTIAPGINKTSSIMTTTTTKDCRNNKKYTKVHLDHGCQPVLEEDTTKQGRHSTTPPQTNTTLTTTPLNTNKKSTMPSVLPDWLTHPDTEKKGDVNATSLRSDSPSSLDRPPITKTQEMNITNWIPINITRNEKPSRSQTSRPTSVHNPIIPDLRAYPPTKKTQTQQVKDTTKQSRRMSAPLCDSPTEETQPKGSTVARSASTLSPFRPKQTATVRARAEQARQRQLQLEEEKRKQAAANLPSRTHLRLKQQAVTSIDWDTIKKDRRKTMPASGYSS
ncbi:hypothetical protein BC941DRAFT_418969 [Chlamydoabsidia padenii]|nr:hypothetical protein BC941DRAFT_418969 [Chlamydoabsidia padenii]